MSTRVYRLTVIASAVSWLLLGFHLPAVHQVTHHGRVLPVSAIVGMAVLTLVGVASAWLLLRAPQTWRHSRESGSAVG